MSAFKPRIETMARIFLITVIVFNAFVPTTSSASAEGENEKTHPATKSNSDFATRITLGVPESWASSVHEEVSILSEQIAKQAQQQQADNPVRFRVEAEPSIYISGQPISLKWKVQNLKSQDLANAEMVIHAPAGFTTTDPNPIYTPDSLISIPLSSKKEVSEWNVPAGAEIPIYFTLDLLINDDRHHLSNRDDRSGKIFNR